MDKEYPGRQTHDNCRPFSCVYYNIAHTKPNTVADRAMSVIAWILETGCFCRDLLKRCYVLLSLIYCHLDTYCVGCSAAGVFKKMQTLCTLYERQTC